MLTKQPQHITRVDPSFVARIPAAESSLSHRQTELRVSKVMHKILYLTCQKLSPSPFALHQGREQAQLRIGSTRTNERMLASEKEGSGK